MPKTANIHVRMDEQIKEEALRVFEGLGISVAEAITMYFRQVAINNAIPFDLTLSPIAKKGIEIVSPHKREDLHAVIDVLPPSVDELWVFGSAVTPYCKPDSDLDVCAIGDDITKEDRKVIVHAPRHALDLLTISHSDFEQESQDIDSVYSQVKNKGILVYKKGKGVIYG